MKLSLSCSHRSFGYNSSDSALLEGESGVRVTVFRSRDCDADKRCKESHHPVACHSRRPADLRLALQDL